MCSLRVSWGVQEENLLHAVMRCAAVESSFYSFVLGILLVGGGGGITVAGGVTGVVSSSLTASLFFISSSCSSCALCFPTLVPLRHTSYELCSSSSIDLCLSLR